MADAAALLAPIPTDRITPALLADVFTSGGASVAASAKFAADLAAVARLRGITNALRLGHFAAQVLHESIRLTAVEENLNYSESGLIATFPKRVTRADAKRLARRPEAIANHVYGGRYGNGAPGTGDGWRYRGRGLKQVTFANNYRACRDELRRVLAPAVVPDFLAKPDLLAVSPWAAHSAGWYWGTRSLNAYADRGDTAAHVRAITIQINGGVNGLDDRVACFVRVMARLHKLADRRFLL